MYVIVAVVVALAVLLFMAAGKPDIFSIARQINIHARPEQIYRLIADPQAMTAWSPFEKDANIKREFSGPQSGVGATYRWEGNATVGTGQIQVIEADAPMRVVSVLDMCTPFKAHNTVTFTLTPHGEGTTVHWHMGGHQPFMAKLMSTLIDCDKMVGGDFEKGLARLKTLAEA